MEIITLNSAIKATVPSLVLVVGIFGYIVTKILRQWGSQSRREDRGKLVCYAGQKVVKLPNRE